MEKEIEMIVIILFILYYYVQIVFLFDPGFRLVSNHNDLDGEPVPVNDILQEERLDTVWPAVLDPFLQSDWTD